MPIRPSSPSFLSTSTLSHYRLFLDDCREPSQVKWVPDFPLGPWVIVRSYDAFVQTITRDGLPSHISFDHDLAQAHYEDANRVSVLSRRRQKEEMAVQQASPVIDYNRYREKTGYHCAQWLVEYCADRSLDLPPYTIHSMNPVGRDNIRAVLEGYRASR